VKVFGSFCGPFPKTALSPQIYPIQRGKYKTLTRHETTDESQSLTIRHIWLVLVRVDKVRTWHVGASNAGRDQKQQKAKEDTHYTFLFVPLQPTTFIRDQARAIWPAA
jgi:hypothetical protein